MIYDPAPAEESGGIMLKLPHKVSSTVQVDCAIGS